MEEKLTLFKNRKRFGIEKNIDIIFKNTALVLSSFVAIILLGIILVVFFQSFESFSKYGLKFLFTSEWNPVKDEYGAFAAIYGTVITSLFSIFITIPLGVGTAIFITEDFAPKIIREIIGSFVELLAAIPSVVLGLWAIFVMEPFFRGFFALLHSWFSWIPLFSSEPSGRNSLLAILILVVMLLPIVTSISRDTLNQVPKKLRNAAYGIGASRWKTIFSVILPAALSGIMAGVLLALGRAMGETMAVTMIIGNSNAFSWSLLSPGYTISSMLANQFGEADGTQVSSLFYAAFILMILSLLVNIFAQFLVKRFSLKYR